MISRFVYIESEGVIGKVITYGAYASRVLFVLQGMVFDTVIDNDDFCPADEFFNKYEARDVA